MAPTAGIASGPDATIKSLRESEKIINEEFKIWKKSSPLLYDLVYSYTLDWPALTIDWLPELESISDSTISAQFISGTHTSGNAQDFLKLYSVELPATLSGTPGSDKVGLPPGCKFKELKKWSHPGEVNKARYSSLTKTIATMTNSGTVLLYTMDSASPKTLKFHTKEGYGLEWHPTRPMDLLTSTEDKKIALWNTSLDKPTRVFETHTSIVNDLSWSPVIDDVFASVSDSCHLQIHDLRSTTTQPIHNVEAHDSAVNGVAFHPSLASLLVTGGADGLVKTWDLRNLTTPIKALKGHSGPITQLSFKPDSSYLASAGADRRVMLWDLGLLSPGEAELSDDDHDVELVFVHGGHTTRLSEVAWHPTLSNVLGSVAEDSLVDVWRPHLVDDAEEEEEEEEEHDEKDKDGDVGMD